MRKVYVCSSWRNAYYENVLTALKAMGSAVWDWRNPPTGGTGFKWQDAGGPADYKHGDKVTLPDYQNMLAHPMAQAGFASDHAGMNWCDFGILLLPAGNSAHLEAGWIAGRGKKVHVIVPEPIQPDLMPLALNGLFVSNVWQLQGLEW